MSPGILNLEFESKEFCRVNDFMSNLTYDQAFF